MEEELICTLQSLSVYSMSSMPWLDVWHSGGLCEEEWDNRRDGQKDGRKSNIISKICLTSKEAALTLIDAVVKYCTSSQIKFVKWEYTHCLWDHPDLIFPVAAVTPVRCCLIIIWFRHLPQVVQGCSTSRNQCSIIDCGADDSQCKDMRLGVQV